MTTIKDPLNEEIKTLFNILKLLKIVSNDNKSWQDPLYFKSNLIVSGTEEEGSVPVIILALSTVGALPPILIDSNLEFVIKWPSGDLLRSTAISETIWLRKVWLAGESNKFKKSQFTMEFNQRAVSSELFPVTSLSSISFIILSDN